MRESIRAVTVYCSSSRHVTSMYVDGARELGTAIARNGWKLVYGGNNVGCMGTLADAARAGGAKVIGITPQLLLDQGIADQKCDELVVTSGMRDRKALLETRGDAFIALPGGLGTLEEVLEILVGRVLGYHDKPIVLLNLAGFYQPLVAMIESGIEQRFIRAGVRDAFFVAANVTEAIGYLKRDRPADLSVQSASDADRLGAE